LKLEKFRSKPEKVELKAEKFRSKPEKFESNAEKFDSKAKRSSLLEKITVRRYKSLSSGPAAGRVATNEFSRGRLSTVRMKNAVLVA
jgi:hypothetical protein